MGSYSSRKRKRNIRKFWENPLVNLCYTLAVIAFTAGIFGIFALIGKADTLVFSILMLVAGVLLIILGNKLKNKSAAMMQEQNKDIYKGP